MDHLSPAEDDVGNMDDIGNTLESTTEPEEHRMSSSSNLVTMFYELGLKRWGGESAYPVSSELVLWSLVIVLTQ